MEVGWLSEPAEVTISTAEFRLKRGACEGRCAPANELKFVHCEGGFPTLRQSTKIFQLDGHVAALLAMTMLEVHRSSHRTFRHSPSPRNDRRERLPIQVVKYSA